jgi:hypothetical protein
MDSANAYEIGASRQVALASDRQVTEADFERTACAVNARQQLPEKDIDNGNKRKVEIAKHLDVRVSREKRTSRMSPAGLEPTTYGLKVRCSTN